MQPLLVSTLVVPGQQYSCTPHDPDAWCVVLPSSPVDPRCGEQIRACLSPDPDHPRRCREQFGDLTDLVVAKEVLGHARTGVPPPLYAHVRARLQPRRIDLLGNALRNPAGTTPLRAPVRRRCRQLLRQDLVGVLTLLAAFSTDSQDHRTAGPQDRRTAGQA